ncbi:helix-turn-helix domain-containing protein [Micromonospora tulbaghiae]|uniref:helix-turn-helix domain-containing protein n=1 Tax=Micromonospora tulbaghiae TaxID=479978 RepID=UPI0033D26CE0
MNNANPAYSRSGPPSPTDHAPYPASIDFPHSPTDTICRACSYTADGIPTTAIAWPCPLQPQTEPDRGPADAARRLAEAVTARREQLGVTRRQLAIHAGISPHTLNVIEAGTPTNHRPEKTAKLEQGLRWLPGSIGAVLGGGQPTEMPEPGREPSAHLLPEVRAVLDAGLPDEVEGALLAHLGARRQTMEAALVDEATLLVQTVAKHLPASP